MNLDAGRCVIEWTCDLTPERINKPSVTKGLEVHMTSLSLDDGATCVNAGGVFNLNECTVSDFYSLEKKKSVLWVGASVHCGLWGPQIPFNSCGKLLLCSGLTRMPSHLRNPAELKELSADFSCRLQHFTTAQILSSAQIACILEPREERYSFSRRKDEIGWLRRGSAVDILHSNITYTLHKCTTNVTVLCLRCIIISKGGGGSFLYIHSATQREGDVARVTTRSPFPASIGQCHLRFWFYMHGSDRMGTLKVIKTWATSP